jgi:hypothetical protein
MKQPQVYALDLTKIDGSGEFSCPGCGTVISPNDCTEELYSIMETKVNKQGLAELVIRCNSCSSYLRLAGFSLLQKLSEINEEKLENGECLMEKSFNPPIKPLNSSSASLPLGRTRKSQKKVCSTTK